MKHFAIRLVVSLLTFAIGIVSAALFHPARSHAGSNSQDEQAILRVERQYIQANLNADTDALDKILADDFTIDFGIRGRRRVESKAERLALLESPHFAFEAIDTDNVEVEVNGDKAVLTGTASLQSRYGDMVVRESSYTFTRLYEKRQGRWQIVSVRTEH
jgi:ketosteroid isomerase-like protein